MTKKAHFLLKFSNCKLFVADWRIIITQMRRKQVASCSRGMFWDSHSVVKVKFCRSSLLGNQIIYNTCAVNTKKIWEIQGLDASGTILRASWRRIALTESTTANECRPTNARLIQLQIDRFFVAYRLCWWISLGPRGIWKRRPGICLYQWLECFTIFQHLEL